MFADPALSGTCGPVAQLGARMNGIHEVTGSIPVWSTILRSRALPQSASFPPPLTLRRGIAEVRQS
jgi:hypothetical protein